MAKNKVAKKKRHRRLHPSMYKIRVKRRVSTYSTVKAALMIQSLVRSHMTRVNLFNQIKAACTINRNYRAHRAHILLKHDLRRVERPCTMHLHGIRNLPAQIYSKGSIKCKISVYWSSLLHIFASEKDLKGVIRGKKPQWVFTSDDFTIEKQMSAKEIEKELEETNAKLVESSGILGGLLKRSTTKADLNRKSMAEFQARGSILLKKNSAGFSGDRMAALREKHRASKTSAGGGNGNSNSKNEDEDDDSTSSSSEEEEEEEEDTETASESGNQSDVNAPDNSSTAPSSPGQDGQGSSSPADRNHFKPDFTLGRSETDRDNNGKVKYCANFDGKIVKLPCTHGNSVVKFEFYCEGDKLIGDSTILFSKQPGLMYWGKEYNAPITYRSSSSSNSSALGSHATGGGAPARSQMGRQMITPMYDLLDEPPTFELLVESGKPMLSRCGYAKVNIRNQGPLLSSLYQNFGFFNFYLNTWKRWFLSLDGDQLSFFETKHSTDPFHVLDMIDINSCAMELASKGGAKEQVNEIGDTHILTVMTAFGEKMQIKLGAPGDRVFWHEVISNNIVGVEEFVNLQTTGEDGGYASSDGLSDDNNITTTRPRVLPGRVASAGRSQRKSVIGGLTSLAGALSSGILAVTTAGDDSGSDDGSKKTGKLGSFLPPVVSNLPGALGALAFGKGGSDSKENKGKPSSTGLGTVRRRGSRFANLLQDEIQTMISESADSDNGGSSGGSTPTKNNNNNRRSLILPVLKQGQLSTSSASSKNHSPNLTNAHSARSADYSDTDSD